MTDANIVIGIKGEIEGGRRVQRTLDDIDKSGRNATRGMADMRTQMGSVNSAAGILTNTLRTLGIAFGLQQIGQMIDAYTNIQNRLKLVTSGSKELAAVTQELFNIANDTRQSFESTAEVYTRVRLATKDLGLSQRETLDFSKQLNQAVVLSGASGAEAAAGMIQLSQGLASGALRGDELRSVLEQLPAVADVIAKGLGVTRGELRKMGEDGKITADVIIDAFAKASGELDANFAKTTATLSQSWTKFKNLLIGAVGDLNNATGATQLLSWTIGKLGDTVAIVFNSIAALAYQLRAIFTEIVTYVAQLINTMSKGIESVVNTGIKAANVFRKNDAPLVDYSNGITSQDIYNQSYGEIRSLQANSNKSLLKADNAAASFFGMAPTQQIEQAQISTEKGVRNVKPAVDEDAIKRQKQIDKVIESLKFQTEQLDRNNVQQEIYNNLRDAGTTIDTKAGKQIAELSRQYVENSEAIEKSKKVNEVTEKIMAQNLALNQNNLEQQVSNNLKEAGVTLDSVDGQNIAYLTEQYENNSAALERQHLLINNIADAFDGFFNSALSGAEGFGGAIKGLIGNLADLAFQMAVIEPIKNNLFGSSGGGSGIFGALLGGVAGIFGGGAGASYATAAARGASNPSLYGPGFASGGSMTLGGTSGIDQNQLSLNGSPIAKVGRGEVLSVSPAQKGGSGGVVVNQTVNVSLGVQEAVAAQFSAILPQLQKSTYAAVQEANNRGYAS